MDAPSFKLQLSRALGFETEQAEDVLLKTAYEAQKTTCDEGQGELGGFPLCPDCASPDAPRCGCPRWGGPWPGRQG